MDWILVRTRISRRARGHRGEKGNPVEDGRLALVPSVRKHAPAAVFFSYSPCLCAHQWDVPTGLTAERSATLLAQQGPPPGRMPRSSAIAAVTLPCGSRRAGEAIASDQSAAPTWPVDASPPRSPRLRRRVAVRQFRVPSVRKHAPAAMFFSYAPCLCAHQWDVRKGLTAERSATLLAQRGPQPGRMPRSSAIAAVTLPCGSRRAGEAIASDQSAAPTWPSTLHPRAPLGCAVGSRLNDFPPSSRGQDSFQPS